MTVVDRLSKMAYFVPLKSTTAKDCAIAYFHYVVCHRGLPRIIISDRDPRFTAKFW